MSGTIKRSEASFRPRRFLGWIAAVALFTGIAAGWTAINTARSRTLVSPGRTAEDQVEAVTGSSAAAKYEAKPGYYTVRGEVVAVAPRQRQVTLRHEDVPGLMPAMTMPFTVRRAGALRVGVGDRVVARLRVTGSDSWLEALRVTDAGILTDIPASPLAYRPPKPGDAVAAVELRNQNGEAVVVAGRGGRVQVITFIYTRCPLPNYCPLMTQRFGHLQAELREAGLLARVRLYSVTLDPQYDTPAVLRSYARRSSADLRHWQFITGPPKAVARLAAALGEVYAPDQGLINHNLVTAVIDSRGRLYRSFLGSEWRAADLVASTREAIGRESE